MFRNPLTDVIVVLVVVLLILGPKQLPALGRGLREFKDSLTGGDADGAEDSNRQELTAADASPVAASSTRSSESAGVDSERQV